MMHLQALRTCHTCGLEAYTKEDLSLFTKRSDRPYGRSTQCKACYNQYRRTRKTNPINYLRRKLKEMRQRCNNPNSPIFSYYGGRGITICQEWKDDSNAFVEWALNNGFTRELQIDRIDTEGDYSPENCRWVTAQVNSRNRRYQTTDLKKGTRICSACRKEKPLTEFYTDKTKSFGRSYLCKPCFIKKINGRK